MSRKEARPLTTTKELSKRLSSHLYSLQVPITLTDRFTPEWAMYMAPSRIYERGVYYARDDLVTIDSRSDRLATAAVAGTKPYRVSLALEPDHMTWSCSCPMGIEGDFCKHIVAVTLFLHGSAAFNTLEEVLERLPHEALVTLLSEEAKWNEQLSERIRGQASEEGI